MCGLEKLELLDLKHDLMMMSSLGRPLIKKGEKTTEKVCEYRLPFLLLSSGFCSAVVILILSVLSQLKIEAGFKSWSCRALMKSIIFRQQC